MTQQRPDGFDDVVRGIVGEAVRFAEQASRREASGFGGAGGIDLDRARRWADDVGRRFAGEAAATRGSDRPAGTSAAPTTRQGAHEVPVVDAEVVVPAPPHPRDVPTEEQGRALAALDSGRWSLDPEAGRLVSAHDGPAPERPKRLARELRARDWVDEDGRPSRAGARALDRWLALEA